METTEIREHLKTLVSMDYNIKIAERISIGLPCDNILKHPEYLVFVKEVGNNMNIITDKRIVGEKFISKR